VIISSLIVLTTIKGSQLNFNLGSLSGTFKSKFVQIDAKKSNILSEENQILDINFNSESEEDFPEEEINISSEDLLKLEDNISKDQISELDEEQMEEIEIKNDVSSTITKKSKSNFF
jgi:hypothetical protein